MSATKIEWADAVWNPITGCTPISEGCEHCYAKRMANQLGGRYGYPKDDPFRVTFHENRLCESINRLKPQRIFVCSMGDIGHAEVKMSWFRDIMSIIEMNPESVYMFLTKRPHELANKFDSLSRLPYNQKSVDDFECYWRDRLPLKNLWIGVTAENQARADERIPVLLQIPAAVRFVSIEPMLSEIDLRIVPCRACNHPGDVLQWPCPYCKGRRFEWPDWVICGGETGPGARHPHPMWFVDVIDDCSEAGVPVFVKKAPGGVPVIREFPTR